MTTMLSIPSQWRMGLCEKPKLFELSMLFCAHLTQIISQPGFSATPTATPSVDATQRFRSDYFLGVDRHALFSLDKRHRFSLLESPAFTDLYRKGDLAHYLHD